MASGDRTRIGFSQSSRTDVWRRTKRDRNMRWSEEITCFIPAKPLAVVANQEATHGRRPKR
ncbi:hypothetical protein ASPSYDRAFT_50810 [Aspergillus sydowii CBS 593.65]|uniref:Uncharacterized protein n=1 Tax=Aspergillus sydowii CBS 593.65 TaxID=1036612 RepID=A0A1L9T1L2_9EURO|nr:uncharacterized protein ASPSYDRAFT_50810 [Aspergillus sydowii CBS 593.65]OJJ53299.1 hypothetical protein ASPSYDRAFT_50810 [Aspergillus sydowii CBS 593.65]